MTEDAYRRFLFKIKAVYFNFTNQIFFKSIRVSILMFLEQQISILVWFLKDHVTLNLKLIFETHSGTDLFSTWLSWIWAGISLSFYFSLHPPSYLVFLWCPFHSKFSSSHLKCFLIQFCFFWSLGTCDGCSFRDVSWHCQNPHWNLVSTICNTFLITKYYHGSQTVDMPLFQFTIVH